MDPTLYFWTTKCWWLPTIGCIIFDQSNVTEIAKTEAPSSISSILFRLKRETGKTFRSHGKCSLWCVHEFTMRKSQNICVANEEWCLICDLEEEILAHSIWWYGTACTRASALFSVWKSTWKGENHLILFRVCMHVSTQCSYALLAIFHSQQKELHGRYEINHSDNVYCA